MLIDIIKESENKFEDQFPFLYTEIYDGKLDDTNEVKDFLHSSQFALLERLKEQLEPGGDIIDLEYELRPNGLKKFISSLEESITYLKNK